MKKFLSVILAMVMVVCMAFPAMAMEESVQIPEEVIEEYTYTDSCQSTLTVSGTKATCYSRAKGYAGETTKITINQTLQKKNSSGDWYGVTGWATTVFTYVGSANNTYNYLTSGTYRLKSIFTVYAGSKYETITVYSTTKTV